MGYLAYKEYPWLSDWLPIFINISVSIQSYFCKKSNYCGLGDELSGNYIWQYVILYTPSEGKKEKV